jgi:hypothetical protein
MTQAKILTSIKEIDKYLDTIGIMYSLSPNRNRLDFNKYSDQYYQVFHHGTYKDIFLIASHNLDYDVMLEDGSFFQFTYGANKDIHYSFFDRVENILSYEEFVNKYLSEYNVDSISQEYEMYLSTDKDQNSPLPIRYDVAQNEYKETIHPYAHFHFGFNNNIRVPTDKIIKPLDFVDFIIKHMYKDKWDKAYLFNDQFKKLVEGLKRQSKLLDECCFSNNERTLLYLT